MTDERPIPVWSWRNVGTAWLPFADAATPELPLGRMLRLSMFQLTVGVAAVLLIGTLNRVMIVELGLPAWLVAAKLHPELGVPGALRERRRTAGGPG